jgi:hypothetical protein
MITVQNNGLQNPTFLSSMTGGTHDFHNFYNNSHLTDNHTHNLHHNSSNAFFGRERVDSKMSLTAIKNDLSLEHYQHLEQ